jgi:hypothetical protein
MVKMAKKGKKEKAYWREQYMWKRLDRYGQ